MNSHIISSVFEDINALSEAEFAEELARHKEGVMALAFEEIFLGLPPPSFSFVSTCTFHFL